MRQIARLADIIKVSFVPLEVILMFALMPKMFESLVWHFNEAMEWTQDLITILFQQTIVYYIM